jgi:hypothetical protein
MDVCDQSGECADRPCRRMRHRPRRLARLSAPRADCVQPLRGGSDRSSAPAQASTSLQPPAPPLDGAAALALAAAPHQAPALVPFGAATGGAEPPPAQRAITGDSYRPEGAPPAPMRQNAAIEVQIDPTDFEVEAGGSRQVMVSVRNASNLVDEVRVTVTIATSSRRTSNTRPTAAMCCWISASPGA